MGIKNAAFRAALLIIEFPHFRFGIFGILFLSFEFPVELPRQQSSIESSHTNRHHTLQSLASACVFLEGVRLGEERVPQGLDLLVVCLYAFAKCFLAQSDVVEAVILWATVVVVQVPVVIVWLICHHHALYLFLHKQTG